MAKTNKIPIVQTFDSALNSRPAVNFDIDRFDSAILKHGYRVYHHKALRCPCINKGTGSALPTCENCKGIGWFYIEKTLTTALMQSMGNKPEFDTWTEKNAGTVRISTMYQDDVSYMDKFEAIDLESSFTQTLIPYYQAADEKLFAFTIYEPLSINNIYKFDSPSTALTPLISRTTRPTDWDYELTGNTIIFNTDKYYQDYTDGNLAVSVRYKHIPVYCVVDIQREVFKARDSKQCSPIPCENGTNNELALRGQPQLSIGRRLHYVWDAPNLGEPSVFDNTVY